ncbi:MAG: OmpA family protein [Spirochaetes bacterium]|nr:OmpA family protein [Spirochaetota bacterium]
MTMQWTLDMMSYSRQFASAAGVAGKIKYPTISGNMLFISDATALYSIDKNNGRIIWARTGFQEGNKRSAVIDSIYTDPVITGNLIYYGTRKTFIARTTANGHIAWTNLGIESYSGFPNYYDDRIFVQSRDFRKNTFSVNCLSLSTGSLIWQKQIENPMQLFSPVVNRGNVYMPTGRKLYCLALADGAERWQKEYDEPITSCPGFTERDIVVTLSNQITAVLSPENGGIRSRYDTGFRSSPQFVSVRDQLYIAYNYTKQVGGKDITFAALRAYQFGSSAPLWEFLPPFPGGASQPCASKGVLMLPAGNYLYAVGTYYDRAITFGNDGSEKSGSTDTNTTNTNAPAKQTPETIVLDDVPKGEHIVVPNIYFEFNQSYLLRQSIATLDEIAAQLKRNRRIRIEIQGHTDNTGDTAYNQQLSEKRANAVMDYLIKSGISPERLRAVGHGMKQPIADNATADGRGRNRRTEFLIVDK